MSRRRAGARRRLGAVALGAALAGSGCTGDGPGEAGPSATSAVADAEREMTARREPVTELVTVYGSPGTFGRLAEPDATGRLRTVGVDGFAFAPGASASFAAVTDHGRVVVGTFPQTNNQVDPVGTSMSVTVVDPATATAAVLPVPTTAGRLDAGAGTPPVGGADVSDVCSWTTAAGRRVVGVSVAPDKPWPAEQGTFPSLAMFEDRGGPGASAVVRDPSGDRTADALAAGDAGDRAVPWSVRPDGGRARTAQGFNECDVAPGGDLLVTQYLPAGGRSGGVVAIGPDLRVRAAYTPPQIATTAPMAGALVDGRPVPVPVGTPVVVSAREVRTDPSHRDPSDQRAVVVYDVSARLPGGAPGAAPLDVSLPNLFQELRYDAADRRFEARTDLLVLRDARAGDDPDDLARGSTVVYGPDGTLFATATHAGSLDAAPVAVFRRNRLVDAGTAPAALGRAVEPDDEIGAFAADEQVEPVGGGDGSRRFASVFAFAYDAERDLLLGVGLGGVLRAVAWDRAARRAGRACQLDLGGAELVAAGGATYLPRQGDIDTERGAWFVPFQGTFAAGARTVGATIRQYLWGIGLAPLAERCGR